MNDKVLNKVVEYLHENGDGNTMDIADALGIDSRKVNRILRKLEKRGMVESVG